MRLCRRLLNGRNDSIPPDENYRCECDSNSAESVRRAKTMGATFGASDGNETSRLVHRRGRKELVADSPSSSPDKKANETTERSGSALNGVGRRQPALGRRN